MLVSVLELPARWGPAARRQALEEIDALLADGPTDLAVVPELAFHGYVSPEGDFDPTPFAEPVDGPTTTAAAELARRWSVHLTVPIVLREGGRVYNALNVLAPDGALLATYRKRHPWFPERWASPGTEPPPLLSIGGLAVTTAICFDGHFLADEAAAILERADLLLFPSAWVDDEDSRLPLLRGLARGFRVAVANANWGAGVVDLPGQGGSCVLDASGRTVASVGRGGSAGRRADAEVDASFLQPLT